MEILFGPDWNKTIGLKKPVAQNHAETRIQVLLDRGPPYPNYAMHQRLSPDSRIERSPRRANKSERRIIRIIRTVQADIRTRIHNGRKSLGMRICHTDWMLHRLCQLEPNPELHWQLLHHAINTFNFDAED
jgi:hypothetical protein